MFCVAGDPSMVVPVTVVIAVPIPQRPTDAVKVRECRDSL
jgi:hypothetical protein